jgi:alkylated DNA nucleotide flippase Atl1
MADELTGPETLPDFAEAVLDIVDQIPSGRVLAYGDVAELLGRGGPRQVGSVMSRYGSSVPWWRVIRASGEVTEALAEEARGHWRAEGTAMVQGALVGHRVDMSVARWDAEGFVSRWCEASPVSDKTLCPNQCHTT